MEANPMPESVRLATDGLRKYPSVPQSVPTMRCRTMNLGLRGPRSSHPWPRTASLSERIRCWIGGFGTRPNVIAIRITPARIEPTHPGVLNLWRHLRWHGPPVTDGDLRHVQRHPDLGPRQQHGQRDNHAPVVERVDERDDEEPHPEPEQDALLEAQGLAQSVPVDGVALHDPQLVQRGEDQQRQGDGAEDERGLADVHGVGLLTPRNWSAR